MKGRPALFARVGCGTLLALCLSPALFAQSPEMLCQFGAGGYTGKSRTGPSVTVEADRSSGLATRSCQASLAWNGSEVVVANKAAELDLDLFDATIGGTPVAGFQIRQSGGDCCVTYRLYSLQPKLGLLLSLQGGTSFTAQDLDLDDEIEFWTDDAFAFHGFDGIALQEFDFLPTYVLRFSGGALHDVSSEFVSFYDRKIRDITVALSPDALRQFRESNGRLQLWPKMTAAELERARGLRQTKTKVLEIVLGYLYSGREKEALKVLSDDWPTSDRDRIWTAILDARRRGIRSHLANDATASGGPATFRKPSSVTYVADAKNEATSILTRVHQPIEGEFSLDLIIDAAGKVRDIHSHKRLPPDILATAMNWKFVPAWRNGHSVASLRSLIFFMKK